MIKACGLAALLSLSSALAHAQDDEVGGPKALLSIRSVAFHTDNFYNAPTTETSASGGVITPELKLIAQSARFNLTSILGAEYGAFDLPGSEDDYLDGSAELRLAAQPTLRNHLRLRGGFKHGHDAFGVDRTEDATARDEDLDLWNRITGSLHYRYGAPGARVNAEVGVSTLDKHYVTNEAETEPLNYDSTTFDYTLFYNYSSKTSALVDFSRTDFNFDTPFAGVDLRGGELYRARTGVKWLATGKTAGDVRVGYRRRVFESGADDIEGVDWEAGVDWAPVPRSTLRLATAHSEQESYTVIARVIDVQSVTLGWKYSLTSRTRGGLNLEYLMADFEGSDRSDKISSGAVTVEHRALSYLWLVGNVGLTSRDSNAADRDYDRLQIFAGVRLGR